MIPMTVSFLQNKAKLKPKEFEMLLFMALQFFIYVVLGFLVTWILVPMP
jgi:hypothetical protein